METVLENILYTLIPSLAAGLYVGIWLANHGHEIMSVAKIRQIAIAVIVTTGSGPLVYALAHYPPEQQLPYVINILIATAANRFGFPLIALGTGLLIVFVRSRGNKP